MNNLVVHLIRGLDMKYPYIGNFGHADELIAKKEIEAREPPGTLDQISQLDDHNTIIAFPSDYEIHESYFRVKPAMIIRMPGLSSTLDSSTGISVSESMEKMLWNSKWGERKLSYFDIMTHLTYDDSEKTIEKLGQRVFNSVYDVLNQVFTAKLDNKGRATLGIYVYPFMAEALFLRFVARGDANTGNGLFLYDKAISVIRGSKFQPGDELSIEAKFHDGKYYTSPGMTLGRDVYRVKPNVLILSFSDRVRRMVN